MMRGHFHMGGPTGDNKKDAAKVDAETEAPLCDAWSVAEKTAGYVLSGKENAVYSPVCIYEGLHAIRLGSEGRTKDELDALLGSDGKSGDWLGLEREDGAEAFPRRGGGNRGRLHGQ